MVLGNHTYFSSLLSVMWAKSVFVLMLVCGLQQTSSVRRAYADDLNVNVFVVPKDRDESLFLVNFVEYVGWESWPGADASVDDIKVWAETWYPLATRFEERTRLATLPKETRQVVANLVRFIEVNQEYCHGGVAAAAAIRDHVQAKRDALEAQMAENIVDLIAEYAFGTPESKSATKQRIAKGLAKSSTDAVRTKLNESDRLVKWHNEQRTRLRLIHKEHEQQAEAAVAVLAAMNSWKRGESRFDGVPMPQGESLIESRPRNPMSSLGLLTTLAKQKDPMGALGCAAMLYQQARYIPDDLVYRRLQISYLGFAAEIATNAAAKDQKYYSSRPTIPSVMALKLWDRFKDRTTDDQRISYRQASHFARALAFNNRYTEALGVMEICSTKEQFKTDANFHFRYACMLSSANKTDDALRKLEVAKKCGYGNLSVVLTDPDLENLRSAYPDMIKELVGN